MSAPAVTAVAASPTHSFTKTLQPAITLVAGLGVKGDAHYGEKIQHLYDMRKDPSQPNTKQVHLIHSELFDEVAAKGFTVTPGDLGENITTRGIDLLSLPESAQLHIGECIITVTGLRGPCKKINRFGDGLLNEMIVPRKDGPPILKCGIMGVIDKGGEIRAGDGIKVVLPDGPHINMKRI